MKKIKIFYSLLMMMLFLNSWSSTSFDTTLTFNNVKHKLYLSIPSSYTSLKEYPLVISLHWCPGSTIEGFGKDFRNAFSRLSDSLNVIVACPDNKGSAISDADVGIFKATVDSVGSKYKINKNEVFLTGMSCNGYVTVRQGLKKAYPFKGVFAWDPWIASISKNEFDFNSTMPIVLAVGTADPNYNMILNVYDSLKAHNANVYLVIVKDVAHQLDFPGFTDQMVRCYRYLNDTNSISISNIDNIEMTDIDVARDVEVSVSNKTGNDLNFRSIISESIITNPTIVKQDDGKVKITFSPKHGTSGKTKVIFEAEEKNGIGIEQVIFNVKINKTVALMDVSGQGQLDIFPNPANKILNVNASSYFSKLEITDISGRRIITLSNSPKINKIDISNLSTGVYLLIGKNEKYFETKRFVVQ